MAALSLEVAVIPVIAKSDCMTASELTAFKSEVVQRLQNPGLEGAHEIKHRLVCVQAWLCTSSLETSQCSKRRAQSQALYNCTRTLEPAKHSILFCVSAEYG